jgi:hypothetical protein
LPSHTTQPATFKLNNNNPILDLLFLTLHRPLRPIDIIMSIAAPIITFKAGICDLDVRTTNYLQIRMSLSKQKH